LYAKPVIIKLWLCWKTSTISMAFFCCLFKLLSPYMLEAKVNLFQYRSPYFQHCFFIISMALFHCFLFDKLPNFFDTFTSDHHQNNQLLFLKAGTADLHLHKSRIVRIRCFI
jgi:hypothetical protein